MSFFSKIISKVYEVVEDDFQQHLTEHEVLAVINQERAGSAQPPPNLPANHTQLRILEMAQNISEFTPEIEFRLLGVQPSVESISTRLTVLKSKLQSVDSYILQHYQSYLTTLTQSVGQLQELKQFYCGRRKAQETRKAFQRLKLGLDRARRITRLNIHANNLKSTLKLLEKIPRIKNMSLVELKAIDLQILAGVNQQLESQGSQKLGCIVSLCSYINKVSNQEFVFVIDKLKLALQEFTDYAYEELIRTFLIINPSTCLQKLLCSLLEAHLRAIADLNIDSCQEVNKIAQNVVNLTINLHKLLKWHKINKAATARRPPLSQTPPPPETITNSLPPHQTTPESPSPSEQEHTRNRQLSADSLYSQESGSNIEVNQLILVESSVVKAVFASTLDLCLADITESQILTPELELQRFYHYLYALSRVGEVCYNFTGLRLGQLGKVLSDYAMQRQSTLFHKSAKELSASLENEKNEWNRLPFKNDYRCKGIDKLVHRMKRMRQGHEFKRAQAGISRLVSPTPKGFSFFELVEQCQEQQDEWGLSAVKLPSFQRYDRDFEQRSPDPTYLSSHEGDVILSHSSLKLLNAFEKHLELVTITGSLGTVQPTFEHMLLLIQSYIYFIFVCFLSPPYKRMFFDPVAATEPLDRRYTKQRLGHLYPSLSEFVLAFRGMMEKGNGEGKFYANFKREIKEVNAENSQALRAKVVATESCKFALSYLEEVAKRVLHQGVLSEELTEEKQLPEEIYLSQRMGLSEKNQGVYRRLERAKEVLREVSLLLLTESSQKMVGLQLDGMRSVLQSVRWGDPFEQLTEYVAKVVSLARDSYQRLKSSSRGEIPQTIVHRIFVLVWRTLVTFAVKAFLESRSNNRPQNKQHFRMFLGLMYHEFHNPLSPELRQLETAYKAFLSVFEIIQCGEGEESRQLLLQTVRRYEYIFPIVMALLENCPRMQDLSEGEKEVERGQFKAEVEAVLRGE